MAHGSYDDPSVSFHLYDKAAGKSKWKLAIEMPSSLDVHRLVYVRMNSWYPSQTPVEACLEKGFHLIVMIKTNRPLYPKGMAVQAKEFAHYIEPKDTHLVTVGEERYRVYRYEGSLKGLDDAVVLLTWKAGRPITPEHLHGVLSMDRELGDGDILRYDTERWSIECFFAKRKISCSSICIAFAGVGR